MPCFPTQMNNRITESHETTTPVTIFPEHCQRRQLRLLYPNNINPLSKEIKTKKNVFPLSWSPNILLISVLTLLFHFLFLHEDLTLSLIP